MEKTEIAVLIASRPRAFGWIKFQKFMFWLFFILGASAFIFTGFIIFENFVERYVFMYLTEGAGINEETSERLFNVVATVKLSFILFSFFTSVVFFVLARYCHKIIRRNNYILTLEDAIGTPYYG